MFSKYIRPNIIMKTRVFLYIVCNYWPDYSNDSELKKKKKILI